MCIHQFSVSVIHIMSIINLLYNHFLAVELELADFIRELNEMRANWHFLGLALKIKLVDLEEIEEKDERGRYMKAMLQEWLRTGNATWEVLQEALIRIGNRRLAQDLEVHKRPQQ